MPQREGAAAAEGEAMRMRMREEAVARQKAAAAIQRQLFREAATRQQPPPPTPPAAANLSAAAPPAVATSTCAHDATPSDELVQQVLRDQDCPHRCLGVAPGAPAELVRKRYLALALRLHPDKLAHEQARQAFASVESAYTPLSQS